MDTRKFVLFLAGIVTASSAKAGAVPTTAPNTMPVVANYARPLSFEPNRGQTDRRVDFLARGAGYGLFLSHGEAVMVLGRSATVRMRPAGANLSAAPQAFDQQPSKANYFIGSVPERWHTDIPNYAKVRYHDVYRGVDLIYYGNQRELEYDFVVSPGADAGAISLDFEGETKAELSRQGEIVMHTAAGDLRWHKPVAYQEVNGRTRVVGCDYVWRGQRRLRFRVADYDRSKALVIDPVLVYSTYLGGSDTSGVGDAAHGIAVDSHGDAYVTGASPIL